MYKVIYLDFNKGHASFSSQSRSGDSFFSVWRDIKSDHSSFLGLSQTKSPWTMTKTTVKQPVKQDFDTEWHKHKKFPLNITNKNQNREKNDTPFSPSLTKTPFNSLTFHRRATVNACAQLPSNNSLSLNTIGKFFVSFSPALQSIKSENDIFLKGKFAKKKIF